ALANPKTDKVTGWPGDKVTNDHPVTLSPCHPVIFLLFLIIAGLAAACQQPPTSAPTHTFPAPPTMLSVTATGTNAAAFPLASSTPAAAYPVASVTPA